jgi:hypothetical protein
MAFQTVYILQSPTCTILTYFPEEFQDSFDDEALLSVDKSVDARLALHGTLNPYRHGHVF